MIYSIFGASAILSAQPAEPPPAATDEELEDVLTLEAIVITGTNVPRVAAETALPVSAINLERLESLNVSTGVEVFEFIPFVVDLPVNETGTLGASARGDAASLSIRGIGTGNTLVLLNGRRVAAHPISQAEADVPTLAVNINSLPTVAQDRIEILRDGASAIYGTDAVAGVVNYLMERDYDGFRATGRYAKTEDGGANEWSVSLLGGLKFGPKTRGVFAFSYLDRDRLDPDQRPYALSDSRSLAPPPWSYDVVPGVTTTTDTDFDNRSSGSLYGNYTRGSPNSSGGWSGSRPGSPFPTSNMSTSGNTWLVPTDFNGAVGFTGTSPNRNYRVTASDPNSALRPQNNWYYDLTKDRTLIPETQRYNGYAYLESQVTDNLQVFGEFYIYYAQSEATRDPQQISSSVDQNLFVPRTNYWNPFGERFYSATANPDTADRVRSPGLPNADGTPRLLGSPLDLLIVNARPLDFGKRTFSVETTSLRTLGGLRGKFGDWTWESAAYYAYAITTDTESNNNRRSLVSASLRKNTPDALNVFNFEFGIPAPVGTTAPNSPVVLRSYSNPDSVIDPLQSDFVREGTTSILTWDFKTSGKVFELFGNDVLFATGVEARQETYTDERPPFAGTNPAGVELYAADDPNRVNTTGLANDFLGLSPNTNTEADRNVYSLWAEVFFPLIEPDQAVPFIHRLDLSIAGRAESYSDFGEAAKPKIGLTWAMTDFLLLRSSYAQGFRAPNLAQLFSGDLSRSTAFTDDVRNQISATGFPAPTSDGNINRRVFRTGNRDLTPEESTTYTAGFVLEPKILRGFSVAMDWWWLEQTDIISAFDEDYQLEVDEELLRAETQRRLAAGQSIVGMDLTGTGNPNVRRAPVTADDIARFNAYNTTGARATDPTQQIGAIGALLNVQEIYTNAASRNIAGFDVEVEYKFRTPIGRFTVGGVGAYLAEFETKLLETDPYDNQTYENGRARFRGNASILWRHKGWGASFLVNHIGAYRDTATGISQTLYNQLGKPDYISERYNEVGTLDYDYIVEAYTSYNASLSYEFTNKDFKLLDGVRLRFAVNNLENTPPPLADNSRGYDTALANPRGRTYTFEIRKEF